MSDRNRLTAILRPWRRLPVTSSLIAVCAALFVMVQWDQTQSGRDWSEAIRRWGGLSPQTFSRQVGPFVVQEQQLHGPFDLWEGDWWRVVVSAFHHANLLHLLMNCLSLWFLGLLLEPRLGRGRTLTFVLMGAAVSILSEAVRGQYAVGISGAICAMFGFLLVLRRRDSEVAEILTETVVRLGLLWLVAGIVLTALELVPVANAAHFTGLAYGWIAGQVYVRGKRLVTVAFATAHLLLVPVFWYAMHPMLLGRYHWYLAETNPDRELISLQRAVRFDPGLVPVWQRLVMQQMLQNRRHEAWQTALRALDRNRLEPTLVQLAQSVWTSFRTSDDRRIARAQLKRIFGEEASAWEDRLGIGSDVTWPPPRIAQPEPDVDRYSLDQQVELPPPIRAPGDLPVLRTMPNDPILPENAVEGVRL